MITVCVAVGLCVESGRFVRLKSLVGVFYVVDYYDAACSLQSDSHSLAVQTDVHRLASRLCFYCFYCLPRAIVDGFDYEFIVARLRTIVELYFFQPSVGGGEFQIVVVRR